MKGGTIQAFLSAMGCRIQIFFVELLGSHQGDLVLVVDYMFFIC